MGGDHVGLQLLGQVNDPLGLFNQLGIQFCIAETVTQIAAQRGEDQAVVLHFPQKILAGLGGQVLGGIFAGGGIHLDTVGANGCSLADGGTSVNTEGFQNDADGELIHRGSVLS